MVTMEHNLDDIRKKVKGTTLRVYLLLARGKENDYGVREIQRTLALSTVSLAFYHLQRLEDLDLIVKTPQNRYKVSQLFPLGEYEDFFVLKGRFLPREVFFLSFFTCALFITFLFFLLKQWGPMLLVLFATAIVATTGSWLRFYSLWKKKDEKDLSK
ncbi:MAG: hypothetical protein ACFFBD_06050 [Candidatus Hodarchaeota archaeon]